MSDSSPLPGRDYRASHLSKGEDYDDEIHGSPFEHYLHEHQVLILKRVLERVFPNGIQNCLDFACGTGRITTVLERFAETCHGVDVSERMVAVARKKCPGAQFYIGDITRDRDLLPGPYDLITAFRFFGNAQNDLRDHALEAIAQRLSPTGYLVLNNHRNPKTPGAFLRKVTGRTSNMDLTMDLDHHELKNLLEAHGFRVRYRRGIAAWVIRARWTRSQVLHSRTGRVLEQVSSFLPTLARDAVVLASRQPDF